MKHLNHLQQNQSLTSTLNVGHDCVDGMDDPDLLCINILIFIHLSIHPSYLDEASQHLVPQAGKHSGWIARPSQSLHRLTCL